MGVLWVFDTEVGWKFKASIYQTPSSPQMKKKHQTNNTPIKQEQQWKNNNKKK